MQPLPMISSKSASLGPSRSFISGERDGFESVVIHDHAQPVRQQVRRVIREGTTVEWSDCAPALSCAPQQIERLELRDLERAIMSLSEEQRTAVLLLGLTPANHEEIASTCGVPVGTIRSRASRGRATLRRLMGIGPLQHSRAT